MQQTKPASTMKREWMLTRVFDAPRERVWKAWTEPERFKQWWGPNTFTIPVINMDVGIGGKYLYAMRSPDGKDFWGTGTYREIVPPERLVFTDSFSDEKGNIVPGTYYGMGPGFPLESVLTVTFEEIGGKTRLTLKNDDISGISDKDMKDAEQGWNESFDKLADFLKKG